MANNSELQPVFDPSRVGASVDYMEAQLPLLKVPYDGSLIGEFASPRKGQGSEKDGLRSYQPGDDPRHIDWKKTALDPNGELKIRTRFKDINPDFWIVTDMLQSPYMANAGYFSERDMALSAIAGLLSIANESRLPSSVIALNDNGLVVQEYPEYHEDRVVDSMMLLAGNLSSHPEDRRQRTERPRLAEAMRYAGEVCSESVVAVVSDFRETPATSAKDDWERQIATLKSAGNDVITVEITNPWDFELSDEAQRLVTDSSTIFVPKAGRRTKAGRKGAEWRERYKETGAKIQDDITKTFSKQDILNLRLSTDDPQWLSSLIAQLETDRN